MKRAHLLLTVAFMSVFAFPSAIGGVITFETATVHVEVNDTDQDAQVLFTIEAGVELKWLNVLAPDGRRVLRVRSNDHAGLGLTAFTIESAEPTLDDLKQAYPEGIYRFRGRTVNGEKVYGRATLTYGLLASPEITFPADGGTDLPPDAGFVATWNPVAGATAYLLEIEQDDTDNAVRIKLRPTTTSFTVPTGWLLPDTDYQLTVATLGAADNSSARDVHFRTGSN